MIRHAKSISNRSYGLAPLREGKEEALPRFALLALTLMFSLKVLQYLTDAVPSLGHDCNNVSSQVFLPCYSVDFSLPRAAKQELFNNKKKNQAWQDKADRLEQSRAEAERAGALLASLYISVLLYMQCISRYIDSTFLLLAESRLQCERNCRHAQGSSS